MKRNFTICMLLFLTVLVGCENDLYENSSSLITKELKEVMVSDDGYLVFKDQEVYNRISNQLDRMTDEEFVQWEADMCFESAESFLSKIYERVEMATEMDELLQIKENYSDKLNFDNEGNISLKFYATAWDRVLTVDGVMRIGDVFYKFEGDREIIVHEKGDIDLNEIGTLDEEARNVQFFYPYKKDNMKSLQVGTLEYDPIYSDDGKSRLEYSLQVVSFHKWWYYQPQDYFVYSDVGYQFKLNLQQYRKGLWWYKNKTKYYLRDQHIKEDYNEIGNVGVFGPNSSGSYRHGEYHMIDMDLDDYSSPSDTKNGLTYQLFYYFATTDGEYHYNTGYHPQIPFKIYDYDVTLWSKGIGYYKRAVIENYSNY